MSISFHAKIEITYPNTTVTMKNTLIRGKFNIENISLVRTGCVACIKMSNLDILLTYAGAKTYLDMLIKNLTIDIE